MKTRLLLTVSFLLVSILSFAQISNSHAQAPIHKAKVKKVDYGESFAGPRIGFTFLPANVMKSVQEIYPNMKFPATTQFGWQFETAYFATETGTQGLLEFAVLIGGVDQNAFLPSVNGLIGMRFGKSNFEFAMGPNLSLSGFSVAFAIGKTFSTEYLRFPVSLAVVPSVDGVRTTLLVGFLGKGGFKKPVQ